MSKSTDFLNDTIYPAIYDRIDSLFPDFVSVRGDWHSPKCLDETEPTHKRTDKTVITRRKPNRALEQGGESLSLIDLWILRNGGGFRDALESFAKVAGVELPSYNSEEWEKWKEREELLERVCSKMKADLFTEKGERVLRYLTEERGYSEELIRKMGLGVLTPETEAELFGAGLIYNTKDNGEKYLSNCCKYQPLAIPYISGARIHGFKFRTIEKEPKGAKYRNTNGLPKDSRLFGLSPLKVVGTNRRDTNLTIVEGELDALHAQAVGVENIVAVAGGNGSPISEEHISRMKANGVKFVTLLFDNDEAGASFIGASAPILSNNGFSVFVATLPKEEGISKVDTDDYLGTHSGEELQTIIDQAKSLPLYLYNEIEKRTEDKGSLTDKDYKLYREEVVSLLCGRAYQKDNVTYSFTLSPTDRELIRDAYSNGLGAYLLPIQALEEEAKELQEKENEVKQKKEAERIASTIKERLAVGDMEGALRTMEEGSKLRRITEESKFSSLFEPYTTDDIMREAKEETTGIQTNYLFKRITTKGTEAEEKLLLPSGAISFICAPTSHGKSKMLQNLALQTVADEEEGAVLYFSYEEERMAVASQLLNCYAGVRLSNNNLRSINTFYKMGREFDRRLLAQETTENNIEYFKMKERGFSEILKSGKLRIYDSNFSAPDLLDAIRHFARKERVKAVFIDYIQLLHIEGTTLQLREELKEIGLKLKDLAVELRLPIVVACQLNRETNSPENMFSQNIADSADLERVANVVLCLWNSSFKGYKKAGSSESVSSGFKESLEGEGFTFGGTAGTIYAKLTKNRSGIVNLESVLSFDGNTGRIENKAIDKAQYSKTPQTTGQYHFQKEEDEAL